MDISGNAQRRVTTSFNMKSASLYAPKGPKTYSIWKLYKGIVSNHKDRIAVKQGNRIHVYKRVDYDRRGHAIFKRLGKLSRKIKPSEDLLEQMFVIN